MKLASIFFTASVEIFEVYVVAEGGRWKRFSGLIHSFEGLENPYSQLWWMRHIRRDGQRGYCFPMSWDRERKNNGKFKTAVIKLYEKTTRNSNDSKLMHH